MAQRNASRPEAVKAAERRAKKAAQQAADDLRWVMSDPRGRRFIWKLLGDAGIFRTSFTGNSETFFREGQRNLGLQVFNEIHTVAPAEYLRMATEAAAEAKRDQENEEESDG